MPEIFFPARDLSPEALLTGTYPEGRLIMQTLRNLPIRSRENLVSIIELFGNFTTTLAAFYDDQLAFLNLQDTTEPVDADARVSEIQLTKFQTELVDYQKALFALNNNTRTSRFAGAQRAELRARVQVNYEYLQRSYHAELKKLTYPNALGKNTGKTLSNTGREIHVATNIQALQIAQLAKHISMTSNGMVALNLKRRINNAQNTHQPGDDWQPESKMQTTGFGLDGFKFGARVVPGLTAIGLELTPLGWVVVIGMGVTAEFTATRAHRPAPEEPLDKLRINQKTCCLC